MKAGKTPSIHIVLVLASLSFLGLGCAAGPPAGRSSALILSVTDASRIINSHWQDKGREYAQMSGRAGTTTYEQTIRHVNSGYAEKDELPSQFGNTGFKITEKGKGLFKSLCMNPENGGFVAEVITHEPDLVSIDVISIDKDTGIATVTATFESNLTDDFKNFINPMPDYMKAEYKDHHTYQKDFTLHKAEGVWQIKTP